MDAEGRVRWGCDLRRGWRPAGVPRSRGVALSWRVLFETSTSGAAGRQDPRVTVDGTAAEALGVMSQGELRALALSLVLPRADVARESIPDSSRLTTR